MPVMSGPETFGRLRTLNPEVRVLITTGYADGEDTKELLAKGARLLAKPYEKRELEEAIGNIFDKG